MLRITLRSIVSVEGDVTRLTPDDIAGQPVQEGNYRFIGIDDHYFLAAAVNPGQVRAEFRPLVVPAALVQDAKVTLSNENTGITTATTTGTQGDYTFTNVEPGVPGERGGARLQDQCRA